MRDNRCPNCENDIATAVNAAIVKSLQTSRPVDVVCCPHCRTELNLDVIITSSLSRADLAAAAY